MWTTCALGEWWTHYQQIAISCYYSTNLFVQSIILKPHQEFKFCQIINTINDENSIMPSLAHSSERTCSGKIPLWNSPLNQAEAVHSSTTFEWLLNELYHVAWCHTCSSLFVRYCCSFVCQRLLTQMGPASQWSRPWQHHGRSVYIPHSRQGRGRNWSPRAFSIALWTVHALRRGIRDILVYRPQR